MKKMFVRDKCRLYVWFWSIVLLERFWSSFAGEGNKSFKAGCCPNCTAVSSLGLSVLYATTASGHCQCFMRPLHQVTVSALCDHCIRSLSVLYVTTASGHCLCFMRPLHQVTVGALCDHCIRSLSVLYVTTILGGGDKKKTKKPKSTTKHTCGMEQQEGVGK